VSYSSLYTTQPGWDQHPTATATTCAAMLPYSCFLETCCCHSCCYSVITFASAFASAAECLQTLVAKQRSSSSTLLGLSTNTIPTLVHKLQYQATFTTLQAQQPHQLLSGSCCCGRNTRTNMRNSCSSNHAYCPPLQRTAQARQLLCCPQTRTAHSWCVRLVSAAGGLITSWPCPCRPWPAPPPAQGTTQQTGKQYHVSWLLHTTQKTRRHEPVSWLMRTTQQSDAVLTTLPNHQPASWPDA
jgi:hypothetical protein